MRGQAVAQQRAFGTVENEAQRVFVLQREAYLRHPYPSVEERREHLAKLERILVDNVEEVRFKSPSEASVELSPNAPGGAILVTLHKEPKP